MEFVIVIPENLRATFRFGDTEQLLAAGENRICCAL